MSTFGGPGGRQIISKPVPPERGSFPLDHDGECKSIMTLYLKCLRQHRGTNDPECRLLSKQYLQCRMDRNLMAPDEMKNLGYTDDDSSAKDTTAPSSLSLQELSQATRHTSGGSSSASQSR
ncbi:hypothetical protein M501DRAFT_998838 [Patellaria atrata CBS 101060]|uniref:CHCH domain-containing protein n=1 Tax=Patellaria atrata CBS 101060 TaxID=1346257 RepID=A0A9P4SGI2_9PEZI|nr:hypothetical protein M501DRAFT_998838 [Patellaria atrata CBS 101060]